MSGIYQRVRDFRTRLALTLGTVLLLSALLIAAQIWLYTQGLSPGDRHARILASRVPPPKKKPRLPGSDSCNGAA